MWQFKNEVGLCVTCRDCSGMQGRKEGGAGIGCVRGRRMWQSEFPRWVLWGVRRNGEREGMRPTEGLGSEEGLVNQGKWHTNAFLCLLLSSSGTKYVDPLPLSAGEDCLSLGQELGKSPQLTPHTPQLHQQGLWVLLAFEVSCPTQQVWISGLSSMSLSWSHPPPWGGWPGNGACCDRTRMKGFSPAPPYNCSSISIPHLSGESSFPFWGQLHWCYSQLFCPTCNLTIKSVVFTFKRHPASSHLSLPSLLPPVWESFSSHQDYYIQVLALTHGSLSNSVNPAKPCLRSRNSAQNPLVLLRFTLSKS